MKKILCLDFDGVICDSINENLFIAYNSYYIFNNQPENTVENIAEIESGLIREFETHRYLVRPAKEFWLLMHLLVQNISIINQTVFSENLKLFKEKINEFEPVFFGYRENILKDNFSGWIAMHRIYNEFSEVWEEINSKFDSYIITNKNYSALNGLLKYFNIHFEEDHLFSKEKFKSKKDAINRIALKNNIQSREIIFVDDSTENVKDVLKITGNGYVADWGYCDNNFEGFNKISHLKELL